MKEPDGGEVGGRAGAGGGPQATGDEGREGTRSAGSEVEVAVTPEVLWRALTDAREIERWFALDARVEPGKGGSVFLSWRNEYEGTSEILVWDPPFHLRLRFVEWAEVTDYRLEARGGRTLLRVMSSFPADATWDDWVEGTRRGWRFVLGSLRHYLERHPGEEREILYLRRRVGLPREEVWARLLGPGGLPAAATAGKILDDDPPRERTVLTDRPRDGLLRISLEPVMGEPGLLDATVWLQGWGDAVPQVAEVREVWRGDLDRLLPEAEEV